MSWALSKVKNIWVLLEGDQVVAGGRYGTLYDNCGKKIFDGRLRDLARDLEAPENIDFRRWEDLPNSTYVQILAMVSNMPALDRSQIPPRPRDQEDPRPRGQRRSQEARVEEAAEEKVAPLPPPPPPKREPIRVPGTIRRGVQVESPAASQPKTAPPPVTPPKPVPQVPKVVPQAPPPKAPVVQTAPPPKKEQPPPPPQKKVEAPPPKIEKPVPQRKVEAPVMVGGVDIRAPSITPVQRRVACLTVIQNEKVQTVTQKDDVIIVYGRDGQKRPCSALLLADGNILPGDDGGPSHLNRWFANHLRTKVEELLTNPPPQLT